MRPMIDVAISLANAHRASDPKTNIIKLLPDDNEIRLVEVSDAAPTVGEAIPFRFDAYPAKNVDYPSAVILLSQDEWRAVNQGKLPLPSGWDLQTAVNL